MELKDNEFRDLIKKYNDELRKYKQLSVPVDAPISQTENTGQNDKTVPYPFSQDFTLASIDENLSKQGQTKGLDATGSLLVRVFTANQISPIKNATVLVSFKDERGEKLIKSAVTNESGETIVFNLPTVPKESSQSPSQSPPYATYQIKVSADGFFTIDSINVPIFAEQNSVLPIEMLPLPENYNGTIVLNSYNSGATNLQ